MEPAASVIVFVGLLGAAVGSFLNVVIYRLPRDMGVHEPRRSFCPSCGVTIKGQHNIPLLSWLWLGGKCHKCGIPISYRYPVIEAATALVFITIWDQLFVVRGVPGASHLANDWMLALGYLTLFACLLAASAMDIESYTIDIRLCILAMVVGITAHTAHGLPVGRASGPASGAVGGLPPSLVFIGAAMGLTWVATFFIGRAIYPPDPVQEEDMPADLPGHEATLPHSPSTEPLPTSLTTVHRGPIVLFVLLLLGLAAWQIVAPNRPSIWHIPAGGLRAIIASAVLMFLLILSAWAPREVDDAVFEEIEETRSHARGTALRELAWLLPAVVVGIVLFILLRRSHEMDATWRDAITASKLSPWLASHIAPALSAIAALTWAAAIGWTVRILGTLAFGKEAYGTGDIYLMAAIGATAGVWNCFFGFFMASILALVGVAATFLKRSHRAIPFGPWLALGSFCVLAIERPLLVFFRDAGIMLWTIITGEPQ